MKAIYKRELRGFYRGFTGYLVAVPLLFLGGVYTWFYNFMQGSARFESIFYGLDVVLILVVPVLTMRVFAEERRQHTDKLLYSLPVSMTGVVLGKFFAMATVLALPLGVLGLYPLVMHAFGRVSFAMAYGNLFAFYLLGLSLIALGQFLSSTTSRQGVALVLCLFFMLLSYFLPALASLMGTGIPGRALGALMEALSLFARQDSFRAGLFDMTAVVYYLAAIAVFCFLSVQSMEKRRWS